MEFKEKQFDGPYEVVEVEIYNKKEVFKGLLYHPPESYKKPYPLVIYFHGFPQIFPLPEILSNYKFILDMGFAFLIFNFRGYRYSDGQISIKGQYSDAAKVIEFVEKMAEKNIFDLNNINIIGHDFGAFIALILCSKEKSINTLLLTSPILNIKRHVNSENFKKALNYINRFLPGNVRGIENVEVFISKTKKELSSKNFDVDRIVKRLHIKKFKIITGEVDKLTPISEVQNIMQNSNIQAEIVIINGMDHESIEDEDIRKVKKEIEKFLAVN